MTLETKFAADSKYNTEVRCSLISGDNYSIEIDINEKTLDGNIVLGSEEIPEIAYDLVNELDNMESTATIAAFEEVLFHSLAVEFWRKASFGTTDDIVHLNIAFILIADILYPFASIVAGIICLIVLLHQE